jgi:hypothetical protein
VTLIVGVAKTKVGEFLGGVHGRAV